MVLQSAAAGEVHRNNRFVKAEGIDAWMLKMPAWRAFCLYISSSK